VRQRFTRAAWFAFILCLAAAPGGAAPGQFTSFRSTDPTMILEGNWQSCRERDGRYSERVYDHVVNGVGRFELHMGPHREFALFKGVQEEHRVHDSPDNLLKPYRLTLESGRTKQHWEIPSLNLALTVALAGGSRMDCDSWFVTLQNTEKTSR